MVSASKGRVRKAALVSGITRLTKMFSDVAHLRHGNADFAFSGLDWFRPCPVARADGRWRGLVACTAEECGHFFINGALQDQTGSQPAEFRQVLACPPCAVATECALRGLI
jgi:hypothetical protein